MNYSKIQYYDTVNGDGIRHSIFVSGCTQYCEGCFNRQAWDFNYGKEWTVQTMWGFLLKCKKDEKMGLLEGISFLGGEPMHPVNVEGLLPLARRIKAFTDLNIWCWTGYTLDELRSRECIKTQELLNLMTVLVDGKYIQELSEPNLLYRGSSNQKIILLGEV